jgi:hypothetical protein
LELAGFIAALPAYQVGYGISVMASQADGHRAEALECEKIAETARDPHMKSQFEDLARRWRELAAQTEKIGR